MQSIVSLDSRVIDYFLDERMLIMLLIARLFLKMLEPIILSGAKEDVQSQEESGDSIHTENS